MLNIKIFVKSFYVSILVQKKTRCEIDFVQIFWTSKRVGFNKVFLNTHFISVHFSAFKKPKHILKFVSKILFVLLDRTSINKMYRKNHYFHVYFRFYGNFLDSVSVEVKHYQDYQQNYHKISFSSFMQKQIQRVPPICPLSFNTKPSSVVRFKSRG